MSRLDQATDAVRPALKGRVLLAGPTGAGKTTTALWLAHELAEGEPILVIDTEKESALTYADSIGFPFKHLGWEPPYDPKELGATLVDAGHEYGVVIVDSASMFWRGEGGTLDIANGRFTGWKEARPVQEGWVRSLLSTDAHVILCARSKMDHVQEVENGKHVVRTLGMSVVQDDDLEYEMNVSLDIDKQHKITVSKSRTPVIPVGRSFQQGRDNVVDLASTYRDWLASGEAMADPDAVASITSRLNALPDDVRKDAKQAFVTRFGRPDHLSAARAEEALAYVTELEGSAPPPFGDEGAEPTPIDKGKRAS